MKNAIVLCSGGLDSVVTAWYVKKKLDYSNVTILFFDYGQMALEQERECARACASDLGVEFREIKIPAIAVKGTEKHGNDLKDTKKEGEQWYVPGRNLIFLSYAFSIVEGIGGGDVFVGFENEGREHYPDTTPEFVEKVNALAGSGTKVIAPFIEKDKEDIVSLGVSLGVDFTKTFSCYSPLGGRHCGRCLACRLRGAGFKWANVKDPTSDT